MKQIHLGIVQNYSHVLFKDIKIMVWTDFLKSRAPIGLPKIEI